MRVIISAATVSEWMPSFLNLNPLYTGDSHRLKVQFHQSGIGMLAAGFSLTKLALEDKPDLIIQAGIAGTFQSDRALGTVVAIQEETIGDLGVEEDGRWKDLFDLKLEKSSYHPFEKRKLPNQWISKFNLLQLEEVSGITVNEISTSPERIQKLVKKYSPVIESMEGAALHYVAREFNIPFLQIRAISNFVGERNKDNWMMKEAIENLNNTLIKYIDQLYLIS
ncbi:MAG: futalosine hydrolase [Chitinophagaceae bacterium]|nr:futalosine hydrolase [Chitinophagaceae bacterium]